MKVGKDPSFRKDWEDLVLEGNPFEQMFSGKEVVEDVKHYTDLAPRDPQHVQTTGPRSAEVSGGPASR